jgi:DNA-binding SARP family transcriptional activator
LRHNNVYQFGERFVVQLQTFLGGIVPSFQVRLFGIPQILSPTNTLLFLPDKRFQLLAYLAYQTTWTSRDVVASLLWSDVASSRTRHRLRQLLKRLKLLSVSDTIKIERERLRWQVVSDVALFKRAVAEEQLDKALELYSGPFLQGLESDETIPFNAWLLRERSNLHSHWRDQVLRCPLHKAAPHLQRLLEYDPHDKEASRRYDEVTAGTYAAFQKPP